MARRKNLFLPQPAWTAWRLLRSVAAIGVVALLCAAGWLAYFSLTPVDVPPQSRQFKVDQGKSLRSIADQFARTGLISERWSFIFLARALGVAEEIKAGSYEVAERVTPQRLLDKVVRGEFSQSEIRFTEGWTFRQIRAALNQHPAVKHETVAMTDAEIVQRVGSTETSLEGWIFPDTYRFAAGTSDLALLRQAYQKMQETLTGHWERRARKLPLRTAYEALILASIVEKETGRNDERELVAAVFVNRLKRGMRLQTDPSIIYGLGETFDGNLRRRDLLTDGIYNTYMRAGLPPTPIAMPGEASIRATLNPAQASVLYFVARGDGSHQFSSTLIEHNQAVNKYQRSRSRSQ
ncbi:MAG TPA: endolytic transglycosylase MltG [Burkholderiales bacterium]